jgi:hypothetical protein
MPRASDSTGNGRKARRAAEEAGGVTDVLQQSFESQEAPEIAAILRGGRDIAHLPPAGSDGGFRRHTGAQVFRLHL